VTGWAQAQPGSSKGRKVRMAAQDSHQPVMLAEAVAALAIKSGGVYVDGTFGRGGHSRAILDSLGPAGRLVALDRDVTAVQFAMQTLADSRFTALHASFGELASVTATLGIAGRVDGLLLDLGLSSPQIEDSTRGFSFMLDGPLDMRFDVGSRPDAAQWLATASEPEITQVLRDFGEERYARRIAKAVVQARVRTPLVSTRQLAELIAAVVPRAERGQHPATRSFQAIRMCINGEMAALERCLEAAPAVLSHGGRLAVISFHSLEDRVVKRAMRGTDRQELRRLPIPGKPGSHPLRPLGKPHYPSLSEIAGNRRARSAILRVAERL
jgi:16S rRNA (cytosine1402-N4)-methyltransferase